jgi:hypothetical protein
MSFCAAAALNHLTASAGSFGAPHPKEYRLAICRSPAASPVLARCVTIGSRPAQSPLLTPYVDFGRGLRPCWMHCQKQKGKEKTVTDFRVPN